jgi:NADH:ubiquinone oxidoreductase subunit 2 (subunit N)
MLHDLFLVLPELFLTVVSIGLLLVAAWAGDKAAPLVTWIAVAALLLAMLHSPHGQGADAVGFGGLVTGDKFAVFGRMLIYGAAIVSLLAAATWFGRSQDYRAEFPVLILFSAIGGGMMVTATDLLTVYVGLELLSLSSYVLASFQRADARSSEAGLKYFVLGALASGLLLYGISLLTDSPAPPCSATSPSRWSRAPPPATARKASCSASCSCWPASPSRSRPCRSTCGRRTSTKARRRRSRPFSPPRPRSPR